MPERIARKQHLIIPWKHCLGHQIGLSVSLIYGQRLPPLRRIHERFDDFKNFFPQKRLHIPQQQSPHRRHQILPPNLPRSAGLSFQLNLTTTSMGRRDADTHLLKNLRGKHALMNIEVKGAALEQELGAIKHRQREVEMDAKGIATLS